MVNYDPDEPTEEMFYHCKIYARKMLNPIIDWTEEDVWEFLHKYNIPYCHLYDEGWKRLGCIGCPMGTVKNRLREFETYPKYKRMYIKAFDRMIEDRNKESVEDIKAKAKIKHPEIIEAIDGTNAEKRFEYWLEPNAKQIGGGGKAPNRNDSGREIQLLDEREDLIPASIEVHDKKITAVPRWDDSSTGEEVMNWWIK